MTDAHLWAAIAVLALAGWMLTLGMLMRNLLPMANALGALQKISGFIDERIAAQLERAKRVWETKGVPTTQMQTPAPPRPQQSSMVGEIEKVFGGTPIDIGEQPDSDGVEIVE